MKANAKEPVEPVVIYPSFDEQWENTKARAWPVKLAFLHQATEICQRTERTLSDAKYPGIRMFLAPVGLMIEFKGFRETVPSAGVAKVRH